VTYWSLNLVFLGVVALVALAAVLTRRSPRWKAVGLAAVPLLLMTAIFDNLLVGVGIVGYDPSRISGTTIGVAPLEDFAYAIAAVVLLPSLWSLLGGVVSTRAARYSTSGESE
jgi:lycopene cyclase domain-containing protein